MTVASFDYAAPTNAPVQAARKALRLSSFGWCVVACGGFWMSAGFVAAQMF